MSYRIPPSMDEADTILPLEVPRWYAVHANPRCEQRAEASIREALAARGPGLGLEVYLPSEIRWRRHARAKTQVRHPLFVRYLFVRVRDCDLHVIRACDGVEGFVGMCGQPKPIPAAAVRELQEAEAAGKFDLTRPTEPQLKLAKGERVKVTGGQFSGWTGEVVAARGANKVAILLSMFGNAWQTTLPTRQLAAA